MSKYLVEKNEGHYFPVIPCTFACKPTIVFSYKYHLYLMND
jgi:hypothetical protein